MVLPLSCFLTNENGQWILALTKQILVVDAVQSLYPDGEPGIFEQLISGCLWEKAKYLVISVYGQFPLLTDQIHQSGLVGIRPKQVDVVVLKQCRMHAILFAGVSEVIVLKGCSETLDKFDEVFFAPLDFRTFPAAEQFLADPHLPTVISQEPIKH